MVQFEFPRVRIPLVSLILRSTALQEVPFLIAAQYEYSERGNTHSDLTICAIDPNPNLESMVTSTTSAVQLSAGAPPPSPFFLLPPSVSAALAYPRIFLSEHCS